MSAVESSIREVVQAAEDMAGETVETILVAATGCQPHSRTLRVELALGGHEVTEGDLKSIATQSIRQDLLGPDRQVLHGLTVGYEIDGLRGINDPRGMRGEKLCARVHVVSGAKSSIQNLTNCVGHCHLGVESVIFGGYASGLASLVQDEIDLGTVCVDMGAGVTSISIFQNNAMVHSDAIPLCVSH
jgi:cell division protein FtsA